MSQTPANFEKKNAALTVSQLNRQVKRLLEVSYGQTWVTGEISGLARPSSGHWYFTLKDQKAQIRCAMFRAANQRLKFLPKEGDELLLRGKLSLYEGRGEYQLIVDSLEPAGIGQLQAAFEQLKLKLAAEGLFDASRKKTIPELPKRVCVITSRTGAVIHDIITVAGRRFPAVEITLIPVAVQGEKAAASISEAIQMANHLKLGDVLIVGRGGGSLEDLWAFNEEVLARAIAASELPVISAVGHEVDVTIADMVADVRAPTPSAAAEWVTPDQFELTQKLDDQLRRLQFLIKSTLNTQANSLKAFEKRVQHPGNALKLKAERALALSKSLKQLVELGIERRESTVMKDRARLASFKPDLLLEQATNRCHSGASRLRAALERRVLTKQQRFGLAANKLNLVSPLSTLQRGYSIIQSENGQVVRSVTAVKTGDDVTAKLADGDIQLKVSEISQKK